MHPPELDALAAAEGESPFRPNPFFNNLTGFVAFLRASGGFEIR
jgi:hypothetical protein